jgi:CSLREA domain-containing protein
VDSLADDEDDGCGTRSCTLREALMDTRPRYVLFGVSGTVELDTAGCGRRGRGNIDLAGPQSCVTVAGQTSPGGVILANRMITLNEGFRHGVFRHLRVRPGLWTDGNACPRRVISNCNRWQWRCDGDVEGRGCSCPEEGGESRSCRPGVCQELRPATCSPHLVGELGPFGCRRCRQWRSQQPDEYRGCSDITVADAGSTDAFDIRNASFVYLDHVSATWALDETISIYGLGAISDLTIANSIISAPHLSSDQHPGQMEQPHAYGSLFGGMLTREIRRVTVARNLWSHSALRNPLIRGGRYQIVNNVMYSNVGDSTQLQTPPPQQSGRRQLRHADGAPTLQADLIGNLFRAGPDWRAPTLAACPGSDDERCKSWFGGCSRCPGWWGECGGGTHAGRACRSDSDCGRGARCGYRYPWFIAALGESDPGSVYLAGNRGEICADGYEPCRPGWGAAPAPPTPSLGEGQEQWDLVVPTPGRPRWPSELDPMDWFHPGPGRAGQNIRRDRPLKDAPLVPVPQLPAEGLWEQLSGEIGASLPSRDRVDADLVAAVSEGRGRPASSTPVDMHCLADPAAPKKPCARTVCVSDLATRCTIGHVPTGASGQFLRSTDCPDNGACLYIEGPDPACGAFASDVCGWPEGRYPYPNLASGALRWDDADQDGLPDFWEAQHALTDALGDEDADGYPNLEEWLCGNDPRAGAETTCTGPGPLGQISR